MSQASILFIDAYDSFSNNITALLREELGVRVDVVKIDDPELVDSHESLVERTQRYDAIVVGPGPGHPANKKDIGIIEPLWHLPEDRILPILGICLGFQSLCLAYGAQTARLAEPRHGLSTPVTHQSTGIFKAAGDVLATQYHSLHMLLESGQCGQSAFWQPTKACPELVPTAWDLSDDRNGPILMGVEHFTKPFAGVQFHPESICTNLEGRRLIRTWWQQSCAWSKTHRAQRITAPSAILNACGVERTLPPATSHIKVKWQKLDVSLETLDVVELFRRQNQGRPPILLQSGCRHGHPLNPETGRFSIIGLWSDSSIQLRYSVGDSLLSTLNDQGAKSRPANISELFESLQDFMNARKAVNGPAEVPFWGGLTGYISYEAGLASTNVEPSATSSHHSDVWFVFVTRSIVLDHVTGSIYVQSLNNDDQCWIDETIGTLRDASGKHANGFIQSPPDAIVITQPKESVYLDKVEQCQEHLRAGSSYELCLTNQTEVRTSEDAYSIYRRLSRLNPAPFGAFLDFRDQDGQNGVTVVGSSPERFLSWSREGKCQFRPIKGTVSKASGATRADAEAILRTQKEMAENLMIVDLIRHDLAGVKGVHDVRVPSLMSVEEYETVFQLVSVIEGDLDSSTSGIDVLTASLPPGSMTGAPKKRSCELLRGLEDNKPRGLYSGVIGYLDVGGGGDFSVVIRTAFKWSDESAWRVGAGGAVTVLSTPQGEYEEMLVKRERLLDVLLQSNA